MILNKPHAIISFAALALAFGSPALAVAPTPSAPEEALTEEDYDLDEEDLDVDDDQVTEEDMNDDTEIVDTELGKEQEAEESLTVEPKDDGQDLVQAAEEYLARTSLKEAAEGEEAAPAPRAVEVAVQLPEDETLPQVTAEVAPVRQPAALASALTVKPEVLKSKAFVVKIQEALIAQGAKIKADGDMGSATQAALIDYQKKNGLAADGIAGPGTLAKLGLAP